MIGASAKVRKQTYMFHCEFRPEKTAVLDDAGIKQRVWWYNGLRTIYHLDHYWPAEPSQKLSIPDLKSFGAPDFARFEMGWKTGIFARPDGTISLAVRPTRSPRCVPSPSVTRASTPDGPAPVTWRHGRRVRAGAEPLRPAEADRIVFRTLFGPGAERTARQWSDEYNDSSVLSRASEHAPDAAAKQQARERFAAGMPCANRSTPSRHAGGRSCRSSAGLRRRAHAQSRQKVESLPAAAVRPPSRSTQAGRTTFIAIKTHDLVSAG